MATIVAPWTCPNCRSRVATPFCPGCGERPVAAPDLTLKGLLAQLLKAFNGVDGRLLRSLRELLLRPGALTLAHAEGRRKPYVGPFQLFLIVNVLFFAAQSLTHTRIFSSSLDSHLHRQDWSAVAARMLDAHLRAEHTTLERFAPLFDRAVVLNAKSLVILMVVPCAALLPLVFRRSRRPFAVHAAFALHLHAFLLLLFCVSLLAVAADLLRGGAGLEAQSMDNALTLFNLAACAVYVYLAAGRVYAVRGAARVVSALGLTLAVGAIVLAYRFAIFAITLYAT